ncbi:MAG: A/G-specific adenine glycosylase [Longimicrobiales bacterium]
MRSRPDETRADLNDADPSPSPDSDEVVPNSAAGVPPGVAEVVNRVAALAPEIRHILLRAYDEGKRDLPWRRETDPYRVWVSEVMLQQTRVETVIPYYRTWVTRFPDLESLAAAEEEDVLRAWKGLGYYSRARNLQRAARVVRERFNGKLPADGNDLRSLPGIGEYTAGALASIAFGRPVPAVDGNVRRVLARLFDLPDPGAAELRALASELVDPRRPGDFNQALMELGALVCTPRSPDCGACPISRHCHALAAGTVGERPARRKRKPVPEVETVVLVAVARQRPRDRPTPGVRADPRFFLRRRPSKGLLAGMWEFPGVDRMGQAPGPEELRTWVRSMAEDLGMDSPGRLRVLPAVPHVFTHLKVGYRPLLLEVGGDELASGGKEASGWFTPDQVAELPLPVAQGKIFRAAMELMGASDGILV